jgi:hypothetical protein
MHDWLRSAALLAMAFTAVVVVTLALSGTIVPDRPAATLDGGAEATATPGSVGPFANPQPTSGGIPGLGGTLTVSGDYEGSVRLTRESVQESYALEGDGARLVFGGASPVTVAQVSFDGWQFFPDEDQCTLTAGNLDNAIGIGFAELSCVGLEEVRDKGTVDLAGEVGMPVDLLSERTLPDAGGTLTVGDETWTIGWSFLATWQQPILGGVEAHNMELEDVERGTALNFTYDIETHAITPATIVRDGEEATVDPGACRIAREELGKHNPRTTVIGLAISCPAVEVPGLGSVPISGTVVVDELQFPE